VDSSSHGLACLRLFAVPLCARPLQDAPKSLPRFAGTTRRLPVPPSWSLTTSTVSSARSLRVCCAPLPALRFAAFPGVDPRRTRRAPTVGLVSRDGSRTLRRVPLVSSRSASLRPLPSYRWTPTSSLEPSSLASEETPAKTELSGGRSLPLGRALLRRGGDPSARGLPKQSLAPLRGTEVRRRWRRSAGYFDSRHRQGHLQITEIVEPCSPVLRTD
jgi:hypothetical protein